MGTAAYLLLFCIYIWMVCRFLYVIIKWKHAKNHVTFPLTEAAIAAVRIDPRKQVAYPNVSKQRTGVWKQSILLIIMIALSLAGMYFQEFELALYPLIFIPLMETNGFLNLFAVTDEGILCGERFAAWEKVQSFEFVRIDVNHQYYGITKEVNDSYVLIVKKRFFKVHCIITDDSVKKQLQQILMDQTEMKNTKKGTLS